MSKRIKYYDPNEATIAIPLSVIDEWFKMKSIPKTILRDCLEHGYVYPGSPALPKRIIPQAVIQESIDLCDARAMSLNPPPPGYFDDETFDDMSEIRNKHPIPPTIVSGTVMLFGALED